jgi:hypothetical protein
VADDIINETSPTCVTIQPPEAKQRSKKEKKKRNEKENTIQYNTGGEDNSIVLFIAKM